MTRIRAWFVTSALRPDRLLAGPYRTLDDCEAACIVYVDRAKAIADLAAGRLPGGYVPRLVEVEVEVPHYHGPPAFVPPMRRPPPPPAQAKLLPNVVYTYSVSALRVLCQALELDAPDPNLSRTAILDHMERELARLRRQQQRRAR